VSRINGFGHRELELRRQEEHTSMRMKLVCLIATAAAVATLAGPTEAQAQHKMTRLGSPATRVTPPISNIAGLKKTFAVKRHQDAVTRFLEIEGLASLTPKVLEALTSGSVTETSVAPGTTIQWMGLRRGGKPDVLMNAVWAGRKPFPGFAFTIDDGAKQYNFVVPKACGNLALLNTTERPLPECVHVAVDRQCAQKQATFSASGTAIASKQATKVVVFRDGNKVGEMLPETGFKLTLPVQAGRYTFAAVDSYKREYGTCERDIVVDACVDAPPPPPPPPPPTSCGALLTATRAKGGISLHVDASASGSGASPAAKAVLRLIGPDGQPVTFGYQGADRTEAEVTPPFQADLFVKKAKPGTYTLRGTATSTNAAAEPRTCESTVYVPEMDNLDWFADGAFGKQRRQYELVDAAGAAVTPGFCDPEIGFKAGPIFWFNEQRASFAPALGVAFPFGDLGNLEDVGDNEYNNMSTFLEAVVNVHFRPRGAYVGTGLGWWDVFDGDNATATWIVNFGAPVKATANGDLFLIGEGRLFFDAPDGVDNNYQLWGGLRYVWR
jgi:hypothetical protein